MKVCAWMLFGALLASPVWAQEPAPSTDAKAQSAPADMEVVVLDAEQSRLLRKFIAQREQAAPPADADASTATDRTNLSPTTVNEELKPIPRQRVPKPYAIGCDDFHCYAFDRSGNVLEKFPRDKILGKSGDNPADRLVCQSENNLLSTFERDAHCRGLGNGLVNPYRPAETASELR